MLVFYMDVSNLDITDAQQWVSLERLKKTDRFLHNKDKKLSLGAEILLKYALSQIGIVDPGFGANEYGKPFLENHKSSLENYSNVHFNISHSENFVACAVSDSPVGVDIEKVHDVDLNIAKHYFFGSEYTQIINSTNKNKTFFEFWVLKESYMKMTGLGFRLGLDEFCIKKDDQIKVQHWENRENKDGCENMVRNNINKLQNTCKNYKFGLWGLNEGDYMLAVCSRSKIDKPELIRLNDIKIESMQKCESMKNQTIGPERGN